MLSGAPELDVGALVMMHAYDTLATCRTANGMVPWDRVRDWGLEHGLDFEFRRHLWNVIRLVDAGLIERQQPRKAGSA